MVEPSEKLVESLTHYFRGEGAFEGIGVRHLSQNYAWPLKGEFPSYTHLTSLKISDGTNYEKNINLKKTSSEIWEKGDKLEIANWVISDWGGIRGNRPETIQQYVADIVSGKIPTELKGVASYSKILSFLDPTSYAIYDARVAISLNAIQLLCEEKYGTVFCYLPGRNRALQLFRNLSATKPKALQRSGWMTVNKDSCYEFYLATLNSVRSKLAGLPLYELEMCLFADAEKLANMYLRKTTLLSA